MPLKNLKARRAYNAKRYLENKHLWKNKDGSWNLRTLQFDAGPCTGLGENLASSDQVFGRKNDQDKPRWDLIPWKGLEEIVKVLTFGAKKYAPDNWRGVNGWRWRYLRAAIGHIVAAAMGEKLDPESGLPHLAHAGCCILFLIELGA